MTCSCCSQAIHLDFNSVNIAMTPVKPGLASSPSATRGACGHRMSSWPAGRTVRERPHQG